MQQCIVKYNQFYNAYDISLSFQEKFNQVRMFFDTGASKTIITLKEFLRPREYIKHKDEITNQLEKSSCFRIQPRTASGNEITGYLCHLNDIRLNKQVIRSFYFFL